MRNRLLAAACLFTFAVSATADDPARPDTEPGPAAPRAALQEGNRLFRDGQIEAAAEAYLRGYSPTAPHPTLVYNLGTALHHLDRLPEAILWYRRAEGSDDLWLKDNLLLARRSLGSQVLAPGGLLGRLGQHADSSRLIAIVLAWVTAVVFVASKKTPIWLVAGLACLAAGLYGGAAAVKHWGPRPAVILEDCSSATGELPAGTEAWVRPAADGRWLISGSDVICPTETVELI
ncbi:MAG: tetratricopeptide repeat protein [bacterium]|nr:tetratricopeptide repeat protein [bacterium]